MFIDRKIQYHFPQFNTILAKYPSKLCWGYWKTDSKLIWRFKIHRLANIILKREEHIKKMTLPNFKTSYKVIEIKQSVPDTRIGKIMG